MREGAWMFPPMRTGCFEVGGGGDGGGGGAAATRPPTIPPCTPPMTPPSTPPRDATGMSGGSGLISDGASIGAAYAFAGLSCGGAFSVFGAGAGAGGGGGGGGAAGMDATNAIMVGTRGRLSVAYSNGTMMTAIARTVCPAMEMISGAADLGCRRLFSKTSNMTPSCDLPFEYLLMGKRCAATSD